RLALIVIDEEHDASYKQHEGFRYSARDLGVLRALRAGVPIVLGSATPSLETLDNVAQGRYTRLTLPERPGAANPARMSLVDLRAHPPDAGISPPVLRAVGQALAIKPDAAFEVLASAPAGATPDISAARLQGLSGLAASVAQSLCDDGIPPARLSLAARTAAPDAPNQIRVYVK
ncbi:MAG: hypothetical protein B7X08_00685, partial [Acidocella sp. 20-63-7]